MCVRACVWGGDEGDGLRERGGRVRSGICFIVEYFLEDAIEIVHFIPPPNDRKKKKGGGLEDEEEEKEVCVDM